MCEIALQRFEPPYANVSRAAWVQVVMDAWQTETWYEPLITLIPGRTDNIASSLKRRVLTDAGEKEKPGETQIRQMIEKGIESVWNINTESISYRAHCGKVHASFKSLDAARGWRMLAYRYEREGRRAVDVPREEWNLEQLEELGRNTQVDLF